MHLKCSKSNLNQVLQIDCICYSALYVCLTISATCISWEVSLSLKKKKKKKKKEKKKRKKKQKKKKKKTIGVNIATNRFTEVNAKF